MKSGSRRPPRHSKHTSKPKRAGGYRHGKKASEQPREQRKQPDGPIRLNRYIAQAGLASRRKADEMIAEGLVKVNEKVVKEMGTKVNPGDKVAVNGKHITPKPFDYFILNKPTDTITTTSDERGRKTVMNLFDLPAEEMEGLFPVGRLDRHTKGVLIVTNDGDLAHRLMHPRFKVDKLYRVETENPVTKEQLEKLIKGVELEDGLVKADEAGFVETNDGRVLGMRLHQGKNRQIRRMMEALGHRVKDLERVSYAGLNTKGIRRGRWRRLNQGELRKLRRLVKLI